MVQVDGLTYRVVQVASEQYEVVRILDDLRIGSFLVGGAIPPLRLDGQRDVVSEVAREALHQARTSWAPRAVASRADTTLRAQ